MKALVQTSLFLILCPLTECLAVNDLFYHADYKTAQHQLKMMPLSYLNFLGMVELNGKCTGFISDKSGNVYTVKEGEKIGEQSFKIIRILSDRIILTNTRFFGVIQ